MGLLGKLTGLLGKKPQKLRDFDQSSSLQDAPSGWELPPLNSREAQEVLTQSEFAALEAGADEGDRINPHPAGSREHRLWADNFKAVQAAKAKAKRR